jgi:hypothetical protein
LVDVNQDGRVDVLSGSYSRKQEGMAGLFHYAPRTESGAFDAPIVVNGADGNPLILTVDAKADDKDIQRICTRPTLVDLNGDGKLDLVSGNFGGTFSWFLGLGDGKFEATSKPLPAEGECAVAHHSDPWFFDWDGDGDLDLISGAANGGVFLLRNSGTKTAPKFAASTQVIAPIADPYAEPDAFGDAHLKGPQGSTRVYVDDVDGDGKLDLLVGDCVAVMQLPNGVDEKQALAKHAAWKKKQREFMANTGNLDSEEAQEKWRKGYEALDAEREQFAKLIRTGFVWLFRGK